MSDLQSYTKPFLEPMILSGADTMLTDVQQLALAAWSFMTAVVLNHASPARPFFLPSSRKRFMETLEPPAGTQIWLARYIGRPRGLTSAGTIRPRQVDRSYRDMFVTTFLHGQFLFQQAHPRWRRGTKDRRGTVAAPQWERSTARLWPIDEVPLLWPPPEYLHDNILDLFFNRFQRGVLLRIP